MPNRFSALAQSMAPDIMGAIERGGALERQVQRERLADQELRSQLDRQNRFRELAGQAYGAADPGARQAALAQAAAVDPQSAMALESQFAARDKTQHELMMERMGVTAGALVNAPEPMRPMLYKAMLPELRKFVPNAPEEYDPGMIPVAQQFLSVSRGAAPAQLQYFNQMTQGMAPEDVERARRVALGIEARPTSAGMSMQKIVGPDGREYAVVFDPRTGQPRPVSMEELFGNLGAPPFATSPMMNAGAPSGAPAQPEAPPAQPEAVPSVAPATPPVSAPQTPVASLSPAEKAEQEARARAQVELATKPQIAAETERAKLSAQAQADAQIDLPRIEASANQAIDVIDQLIAHPGLDYITGAFSLAPIVPGTPQAGADALAKQIQGKIFLEAFQMLKGGGQITEIEGAKAEAAMARLQRAQTKKEYVSALEDLKAVLKGGIDRARKKAGGAQQSAPEITATGPNGEKIVLRNGAWVPLQ